MLIASKPRRRATTPKRITSRDLAVLGFLWRWKFATTAAIYAKYFKNVEPMVPYLRLLHLERTQLIESVFFTYKEGQIWRLTPTGYNFMKDNLPELREDGFKSEYMRHDILVMTAHLGEWLVNAPSGVSLCSEQELRRITYLNLPSWVPSPEVHRPDGYWSIVREKRNRIIALEVEVSQKKTERMEAVKRFYERELGIDTVVWITGTTTHAKNLLGLFEASSADRAGVHQFAILEDFRRHGWFAPIKCGSQIENSIFGVLDNSHISPVTKGLPSTPPRYHQYLLDGRKRRVPSQR